MNSGGTITTKGGTFTNVPAVGFNPAYERAIFEVENNAPAVSTLNLLGGTFDPQEDQIYGGYGDQYYPEYNIGNIDFKPNIIGLNVPNLADYRYQGYFAGAGIGYGYAWMLGKHWNLEVEAAIGGAYTWYDKYYCPKCGSKIGSEEFIYWGVTKLAVNIVYVF
jgi:hypothetical protein